MARRVRSPKSKGSTKKRQSAPPRAKAKSAQVLDDLSSRTRAELLECARDAGLTGFHRLSKAELVTKLRRRQRKLAGPAKEQKAVDTQEPANAREPVDTLHKFDLGLSPEEFSEQDRNIPWGYGLDRVTAMAIDPEQLYVYWEVTDEALERARGGLGPAGRDAWPNLRIYDVTSRIFDGTNAHGYFDHSIARTDRQWFFFLGKPTSTAVVEIGLKSSEGYFVRIARSSRVDFPRRQVVAPGGVEWLTVRSATGEVGEPALNGHQHVPAVFAGAPPGEHAEPVRAWDIRRTHAGWDEAWTMRDESFGTAWQEWGEWARTIEWEGPVVRTTWEAGPFTHAVEPARYVEERYEGPVTVRAVNGTTHVVYSTRQVVIRGIGARAERRVLAVWEVHRSWPTHEGVLMRTEGEVIGTPGGSEQLMRGASEVRWRAGSELRLGGASELYLLGASELRYLGASELFYAGASEWRARGASEVRYVGASEWRARGASESFYVGGSEQLHGGASENRPRFPDPPEGR